MIATGVVLMMVGYVMAALVTRSYTRELSRAEWIAVGLLFGGAALILIGVVIWLWRNFP